MKDYFDLWILLTEDVLETAELRRAVETTFDRRKLAMPSTLPSGLSDAFVQDAAKQR
ncbi:nucleotidyl transferase AbiEii/AbiGii toxin family protein [Verminephrobacter eiseniae]|nr:nucleotidyl transferase AbiEii/AbiGii toxin family protein [Verminephrobacter eiseniae]